PYTSLFRSQVGAPVVWVGHSFGGRVGLRLGVHHPDVLRGLVLVSAAGIPLERPWWQRQRGKLRQARFRSADYVQSRALGLRDIFLQSIREDQSPDLPAIKTPTVLLYGANDTETP